MVLTQLTDCVMCIGSGGLRCHGMMARNTSTTRPEYVPCFLVKFKGEGGGGVGGQERRAGI